jgi:dTMP kinase
MVRSLFITLDGIDGTGKTTQCRLLADWLRAQGRSVTQCVDPGSTAIGSAIRSLVLDSPMDLSLVCEMFLFMAGRAQLASEIIQPALLSPGNIVISDRFLLANVVYQGHAGGLAPDQLWTIGKLATGGLEPDLTFVLDLPVTGALQRRTGQADRLESRGLDYQNRVREGFLAEARRQPDRIRVIDAHRSIEAVHESICLEVADVLAADSRS